MTRRKILFLCTGNSCRSQMAEALLRHVAGDRFDAHSAGSHPAGYVHPIAVRTLERMNVPCEGQRSKSWDEYAGKAIDVVITVCDHAAGQLCPSFQGGTIRGHWSLPDPVGFPGDELERAALALRIAERLRLKIEALVALDWTLSDEQLQERLSFLGEI